MTIRTQSLFSAEPSANRLVAERYAEFKTLIACMLDAMSQRLPAPRLFDISGDCLASLPLTTDEYSLANCRLQNAQSYATRSQFGGARFELRLLRGQIQQLND